VKPATSLTGEAVVGLLIAFLALPLVSQVFRWAFGINDAATIAARELLFFALAAALLYLMKREGWGLRSVGVGTAPIGRSLLRALLLTALCFLAIFAGMFINQALGLRFGSAGGQAALPVWATILIVLRSAVVEELFYRGYGIERLQKLAGPWVAALLPLTAFALAHYRQGAGGVLLTFLLGGVLTAAYLRYRDLVALMLAHFTINFLMNVVLPALG
jgi:uncharacterized protein